MSDVENLIAAPEQLGAEEVKESPKAPAPMATGNKNLAILKHNLAVRSLIEEYPAPPCVELAIKNVSESTIATAIFEAVFYDEEGNVLTTVRHGEITLEPETSRAIRINYPEYYYDQVTSYNVRTVRTTTADFEQAQLRRHELRTAETGEEEIVGIVKNISKVKTDAAIVATFFDAHQEYIGTKVLAIRDMEPNTIREFDLRFRPQEGDEVTSYTLKIGDIAG